MDSCLDALLIRSGPFAREVKQVHMRHPSTIDD